MSDSTTSTPRPTVEGNGPKYFAPKDKHCPYCDQAFTSSSLGRHLDLYIKRKNPKAPDGIHDVEEIRKARGGVTRRHVKNARQESSVEATPSAAAENLKDEGQSPITVESPSLNLRPGEKIRTKFNEMGWEATGVINNIPPRPSAQPIQSKRREVSRHILQKTDLEQRQKMSEEWENGKAAELALKEVLQNVRDASTQLSSDLFDFEFYSMTFPALCLHVLPQPTTLFAVAPFAQADSWSHQPPSLKQFEALQKNVRERVAVQHQQRQQAQTFAAPALPDTPATPLPTPPILDNELQRLLKHLTESFNHWKKLPEGKKVEAWQLELSRCYVRALETRKATEEKLEAAEREIARLKSQPWLRTSMDAAQYTQMAVRAFSSVPSISVSAARELGKPENTHQWDYDRLLEKWRGILRESKNKSSGMASQRSFSTSSVPQLHIAKKPKGLSTANSSLQVSPTTVTPSHIRVSNASSSAATVQSTAATSEGPMEEDGGDEDAEGEDVDAEGDDDIDEADVGSHSFSQPPLQPKHAEQQAQQQTSLHSQPVYTHQSPHLQPQHGQNPSQQLNWGQDQGSLSRRSSHHSLVQHHQHMMSNQASPLSMMPMDGLEGHPNGYMNRGLDIDIGGLPEYPG